MFFGVVCNCYSLRLAPPRPADAAVHRFCVTNRVDFTMKKQDVLASYLFCCCLTFFVVVPQSVPWGNALDVPLLYSSRCVFLRGTRFFLAFIVAVGYGRSNGSTVRVTVVTVAIVVSGCAHEKMMSKEKIAPKSIENSRARARKMFA